jgi:hypothetical protein
MNDSIKQLLPVNGYYAVFASLAKTAEETIEGGKIKIKTIPLIAWAVVGVLHEPCPTGPPIPAYETTGISGVCIIGRYPVICDDDDYFLESTDLSFIGYCSEADYAAQASHFYKEATHKLRMDYARRKVYGEDLQPKASDIFPSEIPPEHTM